MRVLLTASNSAGSGQATSAATAVVVAAGPANTSLPVLSGTAKDGQTLSSTTGVWSGTAPLAYVRQWRRCDSTGATCVDVAGATAATYAVAAADIGKTLRVVATASRFPTEPDSPFVVADEAAIAAAMAADSPADAGTAPAPRRGL